MYEHVYVVGTPSRPLTLEEIKAAETALGHGFPVGYREYWLELGQGLYNDWMEVHPPSQVLSDAPEWQKLWAEHWFYETELLNAQEATICLPIAASPSGDRLIYHPLKSRLYLMNRGTLELLDGGNTLLDGLTVSATSGGGEPLAHPFFITGGEGSSLIWHCDEPDEDTFNKAVEAVPGSGFAAKAEIYDYDAHFLGGELNAYVHVYDPGGEVEVSIHGDVEQAAFYPVLVKRMEELGFEVFES